MFDPTQPYTCRNGCKAHIGYSTPFSHNGAVQFPDGTGGTFMWKLDGTCGDGGPHDYDLVNIPATPEPSMAPERIWVNVYERGRSAPHNTRAEADAGANSDRLECVEYVKVT